MSTDAANRQYNRLKRQLSDIPDRYNANETRDEHQLNRYYNKVKRQLSEVEVVQGEQQKLPSKKNLKVEGVKHFKMDNLNREYVRFNDPDNVVIVHELERVLDKIQSVLNSERYNFHGEFVKVGSFKDGTKVRMINEFDCLFVFNTKVYPHFRSEHGSKDIARNLFEGEDKIDPGIFRSRFADAIEEIGETLGLEEKQGLIHGGFASPKFSGVRINKPTVTMLFEWISKTEKRQLTVDLTPAFPVSKDDEDELLGVIKLKLEPIAKQIELYLDLKNKLHYVPIYDEEWYLTSTQLEAYLLEHIPEIPIKKCIKLGKITNYLQIAQRNSGQPYARKKFASDETKEYQRHIESALQTYYRRGKRNDRERHKLAKMLRYGHVVLTPDICDKYRETVKPVASIVSAAIKNQTLTEACARLKGGALAMNSTSEFSLLVDIFAAFGNMDSPCIPHFLLPDKVRIVSVASYASYDAEMETFAVKCKCQKLARRLAATWRFNNIVGAINGKWKMMLFFLTFVILVTVLSNFWSDQPYNEPQRM